MRFTETSVPGAYVIDLDRIGDARGHFARLWCREEFAAVGLTRPFEQFNMSFSEQAGTLRGLHYQVAPHQEAKVARCTRGAAYDVLVDLRTGSPTYGQWHGVELTPENGRWVYVPPGCAHGYLTLADATELCYLVTAPYAPEAERGLRYDDPAVGIEWPCEVAVVSEKDRSWPDLEVAG